jgi:phosphoglycerate dehydrogenase-like enzyme
MRCIEEMGERASANASPNPNAGVYQWVSLEQALSGQAFDAAFISRDVTGKSTKNVTLESTQIFYDALKTCESLRWVHIHSAGADRPIYLELMAKGVALSTSYGANAKVVAHTALAGVLALSRHFPALFRSQREHQWTPLVTSSLRTPDLQGQRALVVGRGPVGLEITRLLLAVGLECEHIRFNRAPEAVVSEAGVSLDERHAGAGTPIKSHHYSELAKVLPGFHWLILACPLTAQTKGLINREMLELLAPGAGLVNVARGEVIVESDLVEVLKSERLTGAYLDVFETEPLPSHSPLWDMPGVMVTPHSAGHSMGNEARVLDIFLRNLSRFANGVAPEHLVHY